MILQLHSVLTGNSADWVCGLRGHLYTNQSELPPSLAAQSIVIMIKENESETLTVQVALETVICTTKC